MYECPNCAGNLKFDIKRQMLYCEYCDTAVDPYDIQKEQDAEEHSDEYEVTVFTCPQCGGEIISEDTTAATFCSFCGAAAILNSRVSRERRPAHIIPFSRTREDCASAYAKMMRRAIFAPKELKDAEHIEKFRGIYMPYWVYSFEREGITSFPGSRSRRRGDYIYTRHYDLECEVKSSYHGLAFDASAAFSDNLSEAIAPFDLREGKDFTPSFLSGFYADTNDVSDKVYRSDAEDMVAEDGFKRMSRDAVCRRYDASGYRSSLKNAIRPTRQTTELAMLPVWFLAYRNGDRVSYAVVNGQTGKAAAEIPIDVRKYLIGSALLAVPIFILLNLFVTLTPSKVLWLAILLAVLSIMISNRQMSDLLVRESGEDDKGLMSVEAVYRRWKSEEKDGQESWAEEAERQREERQASKNSQEKNASKAGGNILKTFLFSIGMIIAMVMVMQMMVAQMFVGGNSHRTLPLIVNLFSMLAKLVPLAVSGFMVWLFLRMMRLGRKSGEYPYGAPRRKRKCKGQFKRKFRTLWKPSAGAAAALLIVLANPVHDWVYYVGAAVCLGMVMWAFLDIISHHNELTTRRLPQLNRRGGDENA